MDCNYTLRYNTYSIASNPGSPICSRKEGARYPIAREKHHLMLGRVTGCDNWWGNPYFQALQFSVDRGCGAKAFKYNPWRLQRVVFDELGQFKNQQLLTVSLPCHHWGNVCHVTLDTRLLCMLKSSGSLGTSVHTAHTLVVCSAHMLIAWYICITSPSLQCSSMVTF